MENTSSHVIAVDGLAATGKGTLARRLADHLDFAYLDTGLLYRAVGIGVLRAGGDPSDPVAAAKAAQALNPDVLVNLAQDPDLRTEVGGDAASKVGAVPEVRQALLKFQQDFAAHPPLGKKGAVLDGRDIGTVIAPHAKVKIYVEASPQVRANRRFLELRVRGENVTEASVLAELQARDARDTQRATVPTKPADDAVILDTSDMNADEAFEAALGIVEGKIKH
ncbi:MAG: (d)CMP kinase [Alphaproteobacteria bacterium]|nr:(d)CMP kinase [Alphaproteobacteria bacterium]